MPRSESGGHGLLLVGDRGTYHPQLRVRKDESLEVRRNRQAEFIGRTACSVPGLDRDPSLQGDGRGTGSGALTV